MLRRFNRYTYITSLLIQTRPICVPTYVEMLLQIYSIHMRTIYTHFCRDVIYVSRYAKASFGHLTVKKNYFKFNWIISNLIRAFCYKRKQISSSEDIIPPHPKKTRKQQSTCLHMEASYSHNQQTKKTIEHACISQQQQIFEFTASGVHN